MPTLQQAISSRQNGFNLVRLVAALAVVVFHVWQLNLLQPDKPDPISEWLAPVATLGELAVALFFMVSGLFISQSWANDPHCLRFTLRRVLRIVPGLLVCLLVTTLFAVSFFSRDGMAGMLRWETWRYILSNTVLHGLQNTVPQQALSIPGVLGDAKLNGPLWTLFWEVRMYLVLALIGCMACLPLRRWLLLCAGFLLLAVSFFPSVIGGFIWEERLWSMFLLGVMLFALAPWLHLGWRHVLCAMVLIGLNWGGFATAGSPGIRWFGLALLMVTLCLRIGMLPLPNWPHLQRHDYSYAVYIYHWPIILLLRASLPPLGPINLLTLTLLVLVPVAWMSWHWVEAPMLRLGQGWISKLRRH